MTRAHDRSIVSVLLSTYLFLTSPNLIWLLVGIPLASSLTAEAEDSYPVEITIDDPLPTEFDETVPGSVADLTPKVLRESGFASLSQVLDRTPNVTWSGGTSRPRFLFIRGVGDLDQYAGSGLPAVTVLNNGLNYSGLANGLSLFDVRLARIERGPTGFFGGPSSLAGLVSFESGTNEFSSAERYDSIVESSVGTGGLWSIAGRTIIADSNSTGSLSIERAHQDGFLRNAFLGRDDTNHQDTATLQGGYRYTWGAGNFIKLHAVTCQNDDGYDAFTIDNTRTVRSDKPGADDLGLTGGSVSSALFLDQRLRLDIDASALRANSTYSYDGDWGNDQFWFPNLPYDYFSITERDRHFATLGTKLTFGSEDNSMAQIGFYTQRLTEDTAQSDFAESVAYRSLDSDFSDKRYAVHGALSHMLSPQLRAWFATRVERQDVTLDSDGESTDQDATAPLFQAGLEFSSAPETTLYAKASRGWRGGGFNVGAAVPQDRVAYDPEYLTEVSLGARTRLDKPESFVDVALFRSFRDDQQVRLELQTDPSDPLSFVYVTDNAASGDILGLEATAHYPISTGLTLDSSAALLDSEFSSLDAGRPALNDRDTALTPNWRLNLDARYQVTERWFTRLGAVSTDGYFFDDANDARSASITLLNGSIGYELGAWSIVIWGHNLLDRRYPTRGFFFGNEPPNFEPKRYIQRGPPLSGGVTVSYQF